MRKGRSKRLSKMMELLKSLVKSSTVAVRLMKMRITLVKTKNWLSRPTLPLRCNRSCQEIPSISLMSKKEMMTLISRGSKSFRFSQQMTRRTQTFIAVVMLSLGTSFPVLRMVRSETMTTRIQLLKVLQTHLTETIKLNRNL